MSYTYQDEQLAYLDWVSMKDYDAKPREIHIREAAADAITHAEAYTDRGYRMAVMSSLRREPMFVKESALLPPEPRMYVEVTVRLHPALQGAPHVAQILAENQIRAVWP